LFGIEVGLKFFFTVFAHWRWWWGRFERTVPTYYSCCWWPLWKQGTSTLKLLLGASLKAG